MLGRRLGLLSTLRLGCRLSGVIWIGTALSRSGVVNYVDSVAMLGIHKLKVLEMAKAAETARVRPNLQSWRTMRAAVIVPCAVQVGATHSQMQAAEGSLGRLLQIGLTPIWNGV